MVPRRGLWLLMFLYSTRWMLPKSVAREPPLIEITRQDAESPRETIEIYLSDGPQLNVCNSNHNATIQDSFSKARSPRSAGWGGKVTMRAKNNSIDAVSLRRLLMTVIQEKLSGCGLVLVYDSNDLYSVVVQDLLLLLPNARQVLEVRSTEDLLKVEWVSTGCGGYLLLLDHPQPLLTFANTHHHTWDYHGRYVFVSQRVEQVEALVATRNGKKTEHILGIVKGGQEGEWRVYMNMLYWGEGVRPVTTWRHHRFTSQNQLFPDKLDDLQGNRWGWQENNTWTGFMGELFRDEADIGLANLYIMINRMGAIEFSAPFSDDRSCFMVKMEEPLPRWHALAYPYHPWSWLAILVGFILSGPVLFLLATASCQCGDETTSLAKLGYSWLFSCGCHFREPQTAEPRMDSTRIFVLFLWLYTMILSIVYSTNLTAFLLVTKAPTSIQTMEEIYQSGRELASLGMSGAVPMMPTRTLWLLMFVSSARWLIPASVVRGRFPDDTVPHQTVLPSSITPESRLDPSNELITADGKLMRSQSAISNNTNIVNLDRNMKLTISGKSIEAESLSRLLTAVVQQELRECFLAVVYDATELNSAVVQDLILLLPNQIQVVEVRREEDLLGVLWVSTGCGGYLLLLDHPQPLLTFANTHHHTWDYHGRYVFVSQRVEQVEALVATRNGKKTEHILGVVKGGQEGEWRVYMNMLYWGEGVRPVTTWRHHRFTSQSQLFPDKLTDLQGAGLRVSTFEFPPSIMYYRSDNGSLLFRYGEDVAIIETLAYVLNFTALFAEPVDGELWGNRVNGTWTGMNGELGREEIDMGVANFFVSLANLEVLEFSAPYKAETLRIQMACFMARTNPPLPRWQALAFPFHPWTWLAIFVGLILSGPVLFLLATAVTRNNDGEEAAGLVGLSTSWQYAFGLHFREPLPFEPRMDTTRIFVLFLWLYTMILTIVYSTNLTAFLLVRKDPASIQTIKELYNSGLEVASLGEIFLSSISLASDPYLKELIHVFQAYVSQEEILELVMEGRSVLLENHGHLEFHTATHLGHQGVPKLRILKGLTLMLAYLVLSPRVRVRLARVGHD
ncbi:hypothetical protein Pcinc_019001 [Petrolisthes cinctipes]|uniref:Uncharacterized protein n=1 Tax=Petrolisthes cinctipes TaxID=88211 RepID=A0AAE1FL35_PETCI|nr:hypothetical protein Pcinc_019001 [Petrolisthes cinctipes]